MKDWLRWNLHQRFTDDAGRDVLDNVGSWDLPGLMIAGAEDRMIAPQRGIRAIADAFGEPDPERVKAQEEFLSQLLPKES